MTAKQKAAAKEHLLRVKELPCCICGRHGPSDAHHVIHDRFATIKPSDFAVIPLCKDCHQDGPDAIHKGKETWREKYGADYDYIPATMDALDALDKKWTKI
jgi:5-methylcytosine-specific restriction endonuclease McrA